jgi:hypothetical protein
MYSSFIDASLFPGIAEKFRAMLGAADGAQADTARLTVADSMPDGTREGRRTECGAM